MSYTSFDFPHTHFYDDDLRELLKKVFDLSTEVKNFVSVNAIKYADPIQWNITSQYEKNTVVIDPLTGVAYLSVTAVPSGIALTRTEFWTPVFDLGQFVVRAAKNFTDRYEADTTLTATFSTNAGEWLVWGDTLYRAAVNITAGDQYVVGSNIIHFTMETETQAIRDIIGLLSDLDTNDKSNLVAAINEVFADSSAKIGDLSNLNTEDKSNIVAAINEVIQTIITTTERLDDEDVAIRTDYDNKIDLTNEIIGQLSDLDTTDTTSIVNAINSSKLSNVKNHFRYYIDGVNGNDDNDGLTELTPYRTIDKALAQCDKYTEIRIFIQSAGTYATKLGNIYDNVSLHIQSTVNDVFLVFDITDSDESDIAFYGGHFNIGGVSTGIRLNVSVLANGTGQMYFDNALIAFTRCNISSRFRLYGCTCVMNACNFDRCQITYSKAYFMGACLCTNTSSSLIPIIIEASDFIQRGNISASELDDAEGTAPFIDSIFSNLNIASVIPSNVLTTQYKNALYSHGQDNIFITQSRLETMATHSREGNVIPTSDAIQLVQKIQGKFSFCGGLTNGRTEIVFSIPLACANSFYSSVSINVTSLTVRQNEHNISANPNDITNMINIYVHGMGITCRWFNENVWDSTNSLNNSPVSITFEGTITLS